MGISNEDPYLALSISVPKQRLEASLAEILCRDGALPNTIGKGVNLLNPSCLPKLSHSKWELKL